MLTIMKLPIGDPLSSIRRLLLYLLAVAHKSILSHVLESREKRNVARRSIEAFTTEHR